MDNSNLSLVSLCQRKRKRGRATSADTNSRCGRKSKGPREIGALFFCIDRCNTCVLYRCGHTKGEWVIKRRAEIKRSKKPIRQLGRVGKKKQAFRTMARAAYIERNGQFCQRCRKPEPHLHIHHLVKRGLGGEDTAENCIALCPACHLWAHQSRENLEALQAKGLNLNTARKPWDV